MDKKIAILIRAGQPYSKTIKYGYEKAREIGAKILLVGVIPDLNASRRFALSLYEFSSYDTFYKRLESETVDYLERAIQYCLDKGITVEVSVEAGGLENVIKKTSKDKDTKLVIVPSPVKEEHHHEFLSAIKHFAHDILDQEPGCPVVSVLAV